MKKTVVAVIAVYGRLSLLKHTIERLLNKNGVDHVVCVGETRDEKNCVEAAGGIFVKHKNLPLGKKWNAGFQYAETLSPDACLFVGSSDWLSSNWLPKLLPLIDDFDLVGKPDFTMMDISDEIRMVKWDGYPKNHRYNEPIGIGRLVSAPALVKMNWKPFEDEKNNSMDFAMHQKVKQGGGKIMVARDAELIPLSISTDRWPNMHKFEDHWNNRIPSRSHIISNMEPYFNEFPEYAKIFK